MAKGCTIKHLNYWSFGDFQFPDPLFALLISLCSCLTLDKCVWANESPCKHISYPEFCQGCVQALLLFPMWMWVLQEGWLVRWLHGKGSRLYQTAAGLPHVLTVHKRQIQSFSGPIWPRLYNSCDRWMENFDLLGFWNECCENMKCIILATFWLNLLPPSTKVCFFPLLFCLRVVFIVMLKHRNAE